MCETYALPDQRHDTSTGVDTVHCMCPLMCMLNGGIASTAIMAAH